VTQCSDPRRKVDVMTDIYHTRKKPSQSAGIGAPMRDKALDLSILFIGHVVRYVGLLSRSEPSQSKRVAFHKVRDDEMELAMSCNVLW
jgi:hypothetical protein